MTTTTATTGTLATIGRTYREALTLRTALAAAWDKRDTLTPRKRAILSRDLDMAELDVKFAQADYERAVRTMMPGAPESEIQAATRLRLTLSAANATA